MFGKPEWFQARWNGWLLQPVSSLGWRYVFGWGAAVVIPALLLIALSKPWEALVWFLFAGIGWIRDLRNLLLALQPPAPPADNVLYIDDEESPVETRHFDLQLRR